MSAGNTAITPGQGHPVPEGYRPEQLTLLRGGPEPGPQPGRWKRNLPWASFENPYRDPAEAAKVIADRDHWDAAYDVHRKSVVLLKDKGVLPLAGGTAGRKTNLCGVLPQGRKSRGG